MKKLTAGIFATLLTMVSVDGAYAAIASKGYVDDQVGEVQTAVTAVEGNVSTLQTTVGEHTTQIAGKADSATVTALDGRVDAAEGEIDTLQTEVAGKQDALEFTPENVSNKTTTLSGTSTDTQYPSAKAVWDTIQTETTGIASDADVTALEGRVDTLETASATHATQTELTEGLATKQDKLSQTGSASQPVYVNEQGVVTAGNTIPSVTTNIATGQTAAAQAGAVATALAAKANTADLGALAELDAVGSAQITNGAVATVDIADKAVTEAKLSDTVNASLDKADSALQEADLDAYQTKEAADAAYAAKSTEQTASTASTNAQTALTNIGTLSQLTTEAKENTVAAINEVAKEAADAATAAAGAKTAADTAQGDVDALEAVVNNETTGLAAAHTAIDALESGKLDKTGTAARATADASGNVITTTYATKAEIADMATDENLALKQDKTDEGLETTNKTVVGAINEVRGTANTANSTATAAEAAAEAAQSAAEAAQSTATQAQTTANAAIPKPSGPCAEPTSKCVLTYNNSQYAWEVIERSADGE